MARNGFKVLDSDMHVMEPPDLWQTYTDPKFRDRAPEFRGVETSHGFTNKWIVEGRIFPAHSDRKPRTEVLCRSARGDNRQVRQGPGRQVRQRHPA